MHSKTQPKIIPLIVVIIDLIIIFNWSILASQTQMNCNTLGVIYKQSFGKSRYYQCVYCINLQLGLQMKLPLLILMSFNSNSISNNTGNSNLNDDDSNNISNDDDNRSSNISAITCD